MAKIFIKANKNKGICDIFVDNVRTEECKRALNMFNGRDIRLNLKPCLEYTRLCIAHDEEAIHNLHLAWNPRKEAMYEIG